MSLFPWIFFLLYGFVYTPLISYITARMEGIAGQFVSLPLVREASFIAGAKYGTALLIALMIAMAAGFFAGAGLLGGLFIWIVLSVAGVFMMR